ncbi:MAG: type III pantothenate kinase [Lachnospiraceae bacterium]|nr:type III pantothenate kinase [Lachnospiraceae bacterium]
MIFVADVGNTNITLGVFDGEKLIESFRITTKTMRTSDEYGIFLINLLKAKNIEVSDIEAVIISSVVPNIMHSFTSGIIKYIGRTPIIVGVGIKTGITIQTTNPRELGADRIVDAVAAYEMYGGPVIVIDFGTATTYDLITGKGEFVAAVTSPGIRSSAKALWNDAAKLPEIEIKKPDSILAKDTITSMQAGLIYGYIGQTEYIIDRIKEEYGAETVKVVATGGLGKIISEATDKIDVYDATLTLHGLRLIYNKNKNRK